MKIAARARAVLVYDSSYYYYQAACTAIHNIVACAMLSCVVFFQRRFQTLAAAKAAKNK